MNIAPGKSVHKSAKATEAEDDEGDELQERDGGENVGDGVESERATLKNKGRTFKKATQVETSNA